MTRALVALVLVLAGIALSVVSMASLWNAAAAGVLAGFWLALIGILLGLGD